MTLKVSYVKKLHASEGKVDWKWKATIATVAFCQENIGKMTLMTSKDFIIEQLSYHS